MDDRAGGGGGLTCEVCGANEWQIIETETQENWMPGMRDFETKKRIIECRNCNTKYTVSRQVKVGRE